MKFNLISTKEILDYEQEIGHELVVVERDPYMKLSRYYVSFEKGESMEDGALVGHSGKGNTIDEALIDYSKQVSCRKMAFDAMTNRRTEIQFPHLIHTKLLGK